MNDGPCLRTRGRRIGTSSNILPMQAGETKERYDNGVNTANKHMSLLIFIFPSKASCITEIQSIVCYHHSDAKNENKETPRAGRSMQTVTFNLLYLHHGQKRGEGNRHNAAHRSFFETAHTA